MDPYRESGVGETFGPYKILEAVGRGNMGVVYKGLDPRTNSHVALKFPRRLSDKDMPGYLRRFYREALVAKQIRHPNIVAVFEVYGEGEHHAIIMEYVEGRPLNEVLKARPRLNPLHSLIIARQVALALHEIHSRDIIHRDIKPGNIMINTEGQAKILDFGVARMRSTERDNDTAERSGRVIGTPNYVSPEVAMGKRADHRSDIYSLGVVTFRMLTGRLPFEGHNRAQLFQKVMHDPLPSMRELNPDIPERVERTIRKALARHPENRYQSAAEFIAGVDEVMEKLKPPPTG